MRPIRTTLLAFAFALTLVIAPPLGAQQPATFTLNISELRSTQGQLIVCLFATRDRFPTCRAGDGVPRHVFPITARTVRVAVPLPRAGSYAVTVIHDEDGNGRLKQNFIGMPTEGVGVTGNPGGIPRFAGSVVELRAGAAVTVRMRYL